MLVLYAHCSGFAKSLVDIILRSEQNRQTGPLLKLKPHQQSKQNHPPGSFHTDIELSHVLIRFFVVKQAMEPVLSDSWHIYCHPFMALYQRKCIYPLFARLYGKIKILAFKYLFFFFFQVCGFHYTIYLKSYFLSTFS